MTLRDQILEYLAAHPGATDAEIAKVFNAVHQQVNIHVANWRGMV